MLSGGAADASSGSDFVQFDGEMPQDRGFEGDAVAAVIDTQFLKVRSSMILPTNATEKSAAVSSYMWR